MNKVLLNVVLKQVLPLLLGALGAWAATSFPAVHQAFCAVPK